MLEQIIPIILAVFGLSVLIFVHELGHLIAAMRSNMEVESFGIGFGKPILSFIYKGIRFNLCWIPFGGYVKIVGMDSISQSSDPKKRTFFTATPYQRLKVAFAGPLANIVFALLLFCCIWATGGREKSYSTVTSRVGWIDPSSELYAKGVRPGDRIVAYSGREIRSSQDHLQAAMTGGQAIPVDFETLATYTAPPKRISCVISPYQLPKGPEGLMTTGVLSPASFVVWNPYLVHDKNGVKFSMPSAVESGIKPYDRIVWVDNVPIFSLEQLQEVMNDEAVFITIQRHGEESQGVRQVRIPRLKVSDMKITSEVRGELSDWQYMVSLQGRKNSDLWFIPYNLSPECVVEHPLPLIDSSVKTAKYQIDTLLPGDQIIAVQGERIHHASELLVKIQQKKAVLIVERSDKGKKSQKSSSIFSRDFSDFETADYAFVQPYGSNSLYELVKIIGTPLLEKTDPSSSSYPGEKSIDDSTSLIVLPSFPLVDRNRFIQYVRQEAQQIEEQKIISSPREPQNQAQDSKPASEVSEKDSSSQYVLGLFGVTDSFFAYNPNPLTMIVRSAEDVAHTLSALVTGTLSPKWMAGPVGIVDSIQYQMTSGGLKEGLFWLSILSINLALLNLLPLPALDGGYILLSLFEMATGIRPSIATLEKIVFPFILLLVGLFLYLTYNDIIRLIMRLMG